MERENDLDGSVLIVGAGALGCPAALAVAAAGVRRIGLADADRVELSNLHRQILHNAGDVGRGKAEVVAERLAAAAPAVDVRIHAERIEPGNARRILAAYDFVIDATDSAASKFLLNDAAVLVDRPLSHAGVVGLEGQLLTVLPRRTACLRCLFPEPPREGEVPSCSEAGILGPLAGLVGLLQADEAVRFLSGEPPRFADRLLAVDARGPNVREVPIRPSPACPLCGPAATIREIRAPELPCEETA